MVLEGLVDILRGMLKVFKSSRRRSWYTLGNHYNICILTRPVIDSPSSVDVRVCSRCAISYMWACESTGSKGVGMDSMLSRLYVTHKSVYYRLISVHLYLMVDQPFSRCKTNYTVGCLLYHSLTIIKTKRFVRKLNPTRESSSFLIFFSRAQYFSCYFFAKGAELIGS